MLIRLVLALALALSGHQVSAAEAKYIDSFLWTSENPLHGGFSGLHLSADGSEFKTISDHGSISTGRLRRDENGAIFDVEGARIIPLKGRNTDRLRRYQDDSEGLAVAPDGTLYISFEGTHRVWSYASIDARAIAPPQHKDFKNLELNASLEALAIDPAGALYTLPEHSADETTDFPVYRFQSGTWDIPFTLKRRGNFLPVGMDFGPDGKLYLLERWFRGIGFSTRVRRFDVTSTELRNEEILLRSSLGSHDNIEGISVWNDGENIRLTMISDDNFKVFQVTEFVEYAIIE